MYLCLYRCFISAYDEICLQMDMCTDIYMYIYIHICICIYIHMYNYMFMWMLYFNL